MKKKIEKFSKELFEENELKLKNRYEAKLNHLEQMKL